MLCDMMQDELKVSLSECKNLGHHLSFTVNHDKNLGRLWLAYTELQGDFYMLQLMQNPGSDPAWAFVS